MAKRKRSAYDGAVPSTWREFKRVIGVDIRRPVRRRSAHAAAVQIARADFADTLKNALQRQTDSIELADEIASMLRSQSGEVRGVAERALRAIIAHAHRPRDRDC